MLTLIGIVIAAWHRTPAAIHQVIWMMMCGLAGLAFSHFLQLPGASPDHFNHLQVLAGPMGVGMSALWLRLWLDLKRRNRRVDTTLLAIGLASMACGLACLLLPENFQLLGSASTAIAACLGITLMCIVAGLLGDRLSLLMAWGTMTLLVAIALIFGLALGYLNQVWQHAVAALLSTAGLTLVCALLWTRNHKQHESRQQGQASKEFDSVTRLLNGSALIRKIEEAKARLKMRSGEGALVAVIVANLAPLVALIGTAGVLELLVRVGARVRREAGLINPVGRYFDRCFIVVLETLSDDEAVARLISSLQKSLNEPMRIRGLHGETQLIALKFSVGHAVLSHFADVSAALHHAERAARSGLQGEDTSPWDVVSHQ